MEDLKALFGTDLEQVKRDQADADARQRRLLNIGGIADNLANRKSFGEFFLNQSGPKQDTANYFDRLASIEGEKTKRLKDTLSKYQDYKLKQQDQVAEESRWANRNAVENAQANERAKASNAQAFGLAGYKAKLDAEQAELKRLADASDPSKQDDRLPLEKKEQVKTLATKNATITAIKNEIDSALGQLDSDKISDEQKIVLGKSLLKTLNSTQGSDAIGAEEAKRLGAFLEFQMFNFRQPGAMFGTDLKGFREQVKNTTERLGGTRSANQRVIDELKGRPVVAQAAPDVSVSDPNAKAKAWLAANPNDPRAAAIAAKLGLTKQSVAR